MTPYDPTKRHRHSTRWRGYDYAGCGAYFVTLVIQRRLPLLGAVREGEMALNPAGQMVADVWQRLGDRWPHVVADAVVIMPNHIHGILWLHDGAPHLHPDRATYVGGLYITDDCSDGSASAPLSDIVHGFKASTQRAYAIGVRERGWPPYPGRLWQRGYHDRVVRNLRELGAIREYIRLNPANWDQDPERCV